MSCNRAIPKHHFCHLVFLQSSAHRAYCFPYDLWDGNVFFFLHTFVPAFSFFFITLFGQPMEEARKSKSRMTLDLNMGGGYGILWWMKSGFRYLLCVLAVFAVVVVGWVFIPYRSILAQEACSDAVFNDEHIKQYVTFATSDGEKLSGWFFNRGQESELVICYAGNSCNAGMFTDMARLDSTRSYLMLNYRGYGESSGRLKETNMVDDACEALRYFSRELQTERVTLLGFSLGTGVGIQVAARMPEVDKIVLAAPFDSMAAVTGVSGLKKWILKDHFYSIDYAPSVKCPVHILYSIEDTVVRPEQTHRLVAAFRVPVQVVKVTGSHTDVIALQENQKIIEQMFRVE